MSKKSPERKNYPPEFKAEALRLVEHRGSRTIAEIAQSLAERVAGSAASTGGVTLYPDQPVTPWVGAGLGWEILTLTLEEDPFEDSVTLSGPEILNVQAGLDISPLTYVEASFGRYAP